MPWRPGFTPVTSEVQAGKVAAGMVERRRPQAPRASRLARTGRRPAAAHGPTRSSVAPSSPITRSGATGCSVHVAERPQALVGGGVAAALLARARVCPGLEHGAP